jgi:hemerythrin
MDESKHLFSRRKPTGENLPSRNLGERLSTCETVIGQKNEKELTMLNWNEEFETGHAEIDSQHRMLIAYVNRLEELSASSNPSNYEEELFNRFMDFLEDYITTHFRDEEGCMLRFRCAAHKDNMIAHTEFLDFFRGFKRRLQINGYSTEVVRELYAACVAWIREHILRIDVQLKPCRTPFYAPDGLATEIQGDSDNFTLLEHPARSDVARPRFEGNC